jgi:hypothetical protein
MFGSIAEQMAALVSFSKINNPADIEADGRVMEDLANKISRVGANMLKFV